MNDCELYLNEEMWERLRTYLNYLDPTDEINYSNGNHRQQWKREIKKHFKGKYYEHTKASSRKFWGYIMFDKPEHKTWFIIKISAEEMYDH